MTSVRHQLFIRNPTGELLTAVIDGGFAGLSYGLRENEPGVLELVLPDTFDISMLGIDYQIELWRISGNLPARLEGDTAWFIRRTEHQLTEDGTRQIFVRAVSATDLLKRRIVAYYAGTSYAEKIQIPGDAMMREIMDENYGPGSSYVGASYGVDPDRDLEPWLTVEDVPTALPGASYSRSMPWRVVLYTLQDIANDVRDSGVYCAFDIIRVGPATYEFRVFLGARGVDHTSGSASPVVISEAFGNLQSPTLVRNWEFEANYIYAAGQGEEIYRTVKTAQSFQRMGVSPFNRQEYFQDARQTETADSIQSEADSVLEESRPKQIFEGKISQTDDCLYGVHWNWGDLVTASYRGHVFDCHVDAITVTVMSDGSEEVSGHLRSETDEAWPQPTLDIVEG